MKKITFIAIAFIVSAGCTSKSKFISLSSSDTASYYSKFSSLNISPAITTIKPNSMVWHWGDNKMPMTWLPKPNMSNIDSVEIYVPKRLTYWLNDSTLVIKKP